MEVDMLKIYQDIQKWKWSVHKTHTFLGWDMMFIFDKMNLKEKEILGSSLRNPPVKKRNLKVLAVSQLQVEEWACRELWFPPTSLAWSSRRRAWWPSTTRAGRWIKTKIKYKYFNMKEKYESQVLVRSSASQTVTFPEENKVQIVSTARQQVGVSRFLDQP